MGKEKRLPKRLPKAHEREFPNLRDYEVTSFPSKIYNCVAYAAGDETRNWDPNMLPEEGYYWPPAALQGRDNDSIDALKRCFAKLGYEDCDSGELEAGYEKVALYAVERDNWKHAAIQRQNGKWSSKLGGGYDILHNTPQCIENLRYGTVMCYMRRPIVSIPLSDE